jgi:hypothetical protein
MRIQLLSIGLLLCTAACGDDSVAGGGNSGGGNSGGSPAGGDNSGAGQVGGAGGDASGGQAPGGAPQGGAGGTSGDGGAQVGGAGGAPCEAITEDPSAIGDDCADAACPAGYTCQGMSGVIFQQACVILCEEDCECPADYTCEMFSDKSTTWKACAGALN